VAGGEVSSIAVVTAPLAVEPVDALFELLRFEDGAFTFDADATPEGDARHDVEHLLAGAEALLAEWREIEAVVPTLASWVTMRADLPGDEVSVDQARWTTLVAVGSGASVQAIGDTLGLAELPVSRAVRDLVDLGVVTVEARAAAPAPAAAQPMVQAHEASADDVAPLPAPTDDETPAESVPAVDAAEAHDADGDGAIPGPKARRARPRLAQPSDGAADVFVPMDLSALQHQGTYDEAAGTDAADVDEADLAAAFPGLAAQGASVDDDETTRQLANLSPRAAEAVRAAAAAETDAERDAALAEAAEGEDEPLNRGLLLKFLSSVKS
jgi:hypothetical protein